MSYPPYPPDPNRPQDTPRAFPIYGRPDGPPTPAYGRSASPQPGHQQPGPWVQPQSAPYQSAHHQPGPPHPPTQYQPVQHQPVQHQPGTQYRQPGYPPAYGPPPPPYGYGYGYPGFSEQRTNGLAIAALAVGLGSLVFGIAAPVAVGLGIAALVQIKRRQERGTGQAVAGLVVGGVSSVVWGGVLALMIAVGLEASDEDYSGGSPAGSGTYIDELVVGECFAQAGSDDEVVRLPCNGPHRGELYAVVTLPPQTWPGEKEIGDQSEAACDKAFEPYVGISVDKSELELVTWYPELSTWSSGDRNVYCGVYGPDGDDLDKTVKNSRR